MSLRAVWILSTRGTDPWNLLFSRTFPTVEKRAKTFNGENYVPLPDSHEFVESLVADLGLKHPKHEFLQCRDTCSRKDESPVYEVNTVTGHLWPVLVLELHSLLFCCLPLVEEDLSQKPPIINIPGVYVGFNLLLGMSEFLGILPRNVTKSHPKLVELYIYVGEAAPFGTPVTVDPALVSACIQGRTVYASAKQLEKVPAWKPFIYKGKNHIHLSVREKVQAAQYGKLDVPDICEVYGTVSCKADLEGTSPKVTVTLGHLPDSNRMLLHNLLTHPCVQEFNIEKTPSGSSHTLHFTPPLEMFPLCHYMVQSQPEPPIKGFYQMKGEKLVELLVQLRLDCHVKNAMDYCELQMPFFHRGPILNVDSSPSHGSILLSKDKKTLVWSIGQKFPSKSLEVLLKATLKFGKYEVLQNESGEGGFCVGQTSYANLLFKIADFTHSGTVIDPKNVQLEASAKYKVTTAYEYTSAEFKIWNSHGDVPATCRTTEQLTHSS
ncbi:AP-5 complex subunit mu-1 [Lamellibrachia satsuma]|nr:AP-5 complex subunit mu-1 [Lamellibrachia satsuma]